MQVPPLFWGACVVCALGGAIGGASIDTTPLRSYSDTLETVPDHQIALQDIHKQRRMTAPRNQYALETPRGRVEVAELSAHGLYRNRRVEPRWLNAEYEDYDLPAESPRADHYEMEGGVLTIDTTHAEAMRQAQPEPVRLASVATEPREDGPREFASQPRGGPKVIDVAAELAARP